MLNDLCYDGVVAEETSMIDLIIIELQKETEWKAIGLAQNYTNKSSQCDDTCDSNS